MSPNPFHDRPMHLVEQRGLPGSILCRLERVVAAVDDVERGARSDGVEHRHQLEMRADATAHRLAADEKRSRCDTAVSSYGFDDRPITGVEERPTVRNAPTVF